MFLCQAAVKTHPTDIYLRRWTIPPSILGSIMEPSGKVLASFACDLALFFITHDIDLVCDITGESSAREARAKILVYIYIYIKI